MPNTDPYHLTTADTPHSAPSAGGGADVVGTLLWLLLVISAAANMAASYAGSDLVIHLACGSVTALSATLLVVRRLRGRR
ncbi:hypothetical protein [Streptomyces lanatus]|uniref:Uncharacterized protein n=1 Tax=Streptomyces lanatus TaxID=66900 RepID=A0ABV1Y854_9ACTN|nr:hypothetical protein [Streptomyces lanatus]GHH31518.1 hypothetical protein GCM10018780_92480 [Streptomyces lanatus]